MATLRKHTLPDERVRESIEMPLTRWREINRHGKNSVTIYRQPSFQVGDIIEIRKDAPRSWTITFNSKEEAKVFDNGRL